MGRYEQKIWSAIVILLVALLVTGGILFVARNWGSARPVEIVLSREVEALPSGEALVYVGGGVTSPGFYPLKPGDTLDGVFKAAGGAAPGADLSRIRVHVPQEGESSTPQRVDLNRAGVWLLEVLPGIGEKRAGDIVGWRESNGPFRNTEDLMKVEGIGPETYAKIKDFITVSEDVNEGLSQ